MSPLVDEFYREVLERIQAIPGVEAAAMAGMPRQSPVRVIGRPADPSVEALQATYYAVSTDTQPDDIAKSIAESVSGTLQFAEGNFLDVAEAMPEDKYSYIPAGGNFDGVRTFGEQVKHVACAQFAFFNEFEGKKPPDDCEKGGHDPAKTKAELIKYLKDSFDYSNQGATNTLGAPSFAQFAKGGNTGMCKTIRR